MLQNRPLDGIYAVTIAGDVCDAHLCYCVVDGFNAQFGVGCFLGHFVSMGDPKTGLKVEFGDMTPRRELAESCKDITKLKHFRNCAPGFMMEDLEGITDGAGGEGVGEHPDRFDPAVRTAHLRVEFAGLTPAQCMEEADGSALGLWAITRPADLPEDAIADCAVYAFHSHIPFRLLEYADFTVTDPSSGMVLLPDDERDFYELADRCLGVHMLEPFVSMPQQLEMAFESLSSDWDTDPLV
nr:hypothetical protein [uncultured Albidiferax sp.]